MEELTLESLAKRVEQLERRLARPTPDAWRQTIGMFRGSEMFREIAEAGAAIREAEREAARRGDDEA